MYNRMRLTILHHILKVTQTEARKMVQQLRAFTAFVEDHGLVSNNYIRVQFTTIFKTLVLGDPAPFSGLRGQPDIQVL